MIKITTDMLPLIRLQKKLADRVIPRSAAKAANRAVGAARSAARRQLRKELKTQADLMKAFIIDRAKAAGVNPSATLRVGKGGLSLIALNPEIVEIQTSRGLRLGVRVKIAGQSIVVPGAFYARMRSGHEGVFRRRGQKRLPIYEVGAFEVLGSMRKLIEGAEVQGAMTKAAEAVFPVAYKETFNDEIKRASG